MSRQTAFELFPAGHAPADEWRVKRAIGELIDHVAAPKKGRHVGFPLRGEAMELEYLNALLERPDTQPLHVASDGRSLMTPSHPDRYVQSPYTKRPAASESFVRSPVADRIRAAAPPTAMLAVCEDILGEKIRYDPTNFSGAQRVYGHAFVKAMPEDSDAKKQHDHMVDIYKRTETLVLNNKWWNGPGIDCDYRVYAVEYLPATFSGEDEVGVNLVNSLAMINDCIECVPARFVTNKHALERLKVDVAEFMAFLTGKE